MRIIIRADGNREIAMGHIMRCLSIADALRGAGAEVVFVTAGKETRQMLEERGYQNHILGTSFCDMEAEQPAFHRFYEKNAADVILVDSYFVTENYMQEIGRWTKTAYMDDMGQPVYPVNMLINYNIYGDSLPYKEWYAQSGITAPEKYLLGCRYAPLRAEFCQGIRSRVREKVSDVLITTGGGDIADVAGKLCRRLAEEKRLGLHRGVRYHIVCGPFAENKMELRALAKGSADFVVHENVTSMSQLMGNCDVAVSAAGGTMYELCSMQVPMVCFYFAENQRRMAQRFAEMTEISNAGDVTKEEERTLAALSEELCRLEQDGSLRSRQRRQMKELTDGKGAGRIAEALLQLV